MKRLYLISILMIILLLLSGCEGEPKKLTIVSGSENETLEPILEDFEKAHQIDIVMEYQGSVDIMNLLGTEAINQYDAVWPANSLWLSIGDANKRIEHTQSIMTSPIVFGIRKSLAEELNMVGNAVTTADILKAIQSGKLKFMMTSATQSNSGACAYLGFLSALLGSPDTITLQDLEQPALKAQMTQLLAGVNRSSGSSAWLKDLFLKGGYDAMVNYEALIIEANQVLEQAGKEPLYLVYPVDGLSMADSPLGYVNKNNEETEAMFKLLQAYLLSEPVQQRIAKTGRRTGMAGVSHQLDRNVFKSEWGIDTNKTLSGITMPAAAVIKQALWLYQTELRKPSFTVFCLDYSGSMNGHGDAELKEAMAVLLTQEKASQYLLQASDKDLIFVIPFNHEIIDVWQVSGNSQSAFNEVLNKINTLASDGGTDIYKPALAAVDILLKDKQDAYSKAVVLLTDGESNEGTTFEDFKRKFEAFKTDIPVYSIVFGQASQEQLDSISELTRGRVFNGKNDLIEAFKKAKGYN